MRFPSLLVLAALLGALPTIVSAQTTTDSLTAVKSRYSLFRPLPKSLMRPLSADRPGVTESPFTVDAGHVQFETDLARHISSRPGAEERQRTIRANAFVLKMGLSNRTDVQLFVDAYEWNRTFATADQPATSSRGFGDLTLRLKHNLLGDDSTESALAVGLIGFVRLPTGGRQGAGGTEYGLLLPATYAFADSWNLSAQLPVLLNFDRDASQHYLQTAPSINLDHSFAPWLTGFVEAVAQHDFRTKRWEEALNVGPIFFVGKNIQLDFGRHFALTREADREYFVGFVIRR
ncbi:transporter [Hymenobacter rubripertinctus]|uniref:Transporter n=1 Tax=Hymenobacter rubripertinctus TaxID=2029981 RepID=A0A418RAL2_9BACT|nr:transporter [Hymenobacter rubripertinctus]RIY14304.1 transporter [Hymenobacter rubripertinctus]